ncbi:MAG: hypothetical protein JXB48_22710 [Candidatus Latescibacteria bacterium]|nr:hypothetical protein [Candidatus Latescibacterota bacterium]
MDDSIAVREFERLAKRLGIEIRYTCGGPSGMCTIKGKPVMFLDRNLDTGSKLRHFITGFKSVDLEGIFVVPIIRKMLYPEDDTC